MHQCPNDVGVKSSSVFVNSSLECRFGRFSEGFSSQIQNGSQIRF